MKRAGLVLMLLLAACAGGAARNQALLLSMRVPFQSIVADVERGMAARVLDGVEAAKVRVLISDVRTVLESGDRDGLRGLDWPLLRDLAMEGIQDRLTTGEIGAGVAASMLERLRLFGEAWAVALNR